MLELHELTFRGSFLVIPVQLVTIGKLCSADTSEKELILLLVFTKITVAHSAQTVTKH